MNAAREHPGLDGRRGRGAVNEAILRKPGRRERGDELGGALVLSDEPHEAAVDAEAVEVGRGVGGPPEPHLARILAHDEDRGFPADPPGRTVYVRVDHRPAHDHHARTAESFQGADDRGPSRDVTHPRVEPQPVGDEKRYDGAVRALVLRLSSLGDVVLTEPLLRALTECGYAVHFVTDARYAPLARRAFPVERVVDDARHGADAGPGGVLRVARRIGGEPFDVIVDLQGKLRTRWLARAVPGRRRLTLVKRTPVRAALALAGRDRPIDDRHATRMYLDVVAPLGLGPVDPAPRLSRLAAPAERLLVGLCPAARHATKRWPARNFALLAERIRAVRPDAAFRLIGGPQDRALLAEVRSARPGLRWAPGDVTREGVDGLARRIAEVRIFVGVDSGPAHIAAASGVSTVVLFGPTSKRRWGPLGGSHQVVDLGLDCAPCSNYGGRRCPRPDRAHACLTALSVDQVFDAVRPMLGPRCAPASRSSRDAKPRAAVRTGSTGAVVDTPRGCRGQCGVRRGEHLPQAGLRSRLAAGEVGSRAGGQRRQPGGRGNGQDPLRDLAGRLSEPAGSAGGGRVAGVPPGSSRRLSGDRVHGGGAGGPRGGRGR